MSKHYPRQFEYILKARLTEEPRFIQSILGPRQVGKTSGVLNVLESSFAPETYTYITGDESLYDAEWLQQKIQDSFYNKKKILVIDETQKTTQWSEFIKMAWDQQQRKKIKMHWILLGSSSLQITRGLSETLAGRFEVIPVYHWQFHESHKAFGLTFDEYLKQGGYPASYPLKDNAKRFRQYLLNSIFETVVNQDILHYATVKKPALFRQTFILACQHPSQEISYNKLLGQLQEAGNVEQIKHYLELFSQAFLLRLIFKYTKNSFSRTSSPKILPTAPVFTSLFMKSPLSHEDRGRIFESTVGNRLCETFESVYFWREGPHEVDFVVDNGKHLIGIEVKSKRRKAVSLSQFRSRFKGSKTCIIDLNNYIEFEKNPEEFLDSYAI